MVTFPTLTQQPWLPNHLPPISGNWLACQRWANVGNCRRCWRPLLTLVQHRIAIWVSLNGRAEGCSSVWLGAGFFKLFKPFYSTYNNNDDDDDNNNNNNNNNNSAFWPDLRGVDQVIWTPLNQSMVAESSGSLS